MSVLISLLHLANFSPSVKTFPIFSAPFSFFLRTLGISSQDF